MRIGVIGGGIFGMAAALELRARGHEVVLFERDVIPAPDASSTDVSKAIRRLHYPEEEYVELVTRAADQWSKWQERSGSSFYYQPGIISISYDLPSQNKVDDGRETLVRGGVELESLSIDEVRRRFPQLAVKTGDNILFDAWGGFLRSGEALGQLATIARSDGVEIRESTRVQEVEEQGDRVHITCAGGETLAYDRAVISAGPWVVRLLPWLQQHLLITRQQMAFFVPEDLEAFRRSSFPVWSVLTDRKAWYGFPLLEEGYVKVAEDNRVLEADPDCNREPTEQFLSQAREFVADRIPGLTTAELVGGRSCLYTNTPDNNFVVDWVPDSDRVLIAGCGCGHGFKFGGAIGPVIADTLEDRENPLGRLFKIGERFGEN